MVEGERAKEGTISGFKARPLNPVLKASKAIIIFCRQNRNKWTSTVFVGEASGQCYQTFLV